MISKLLDNTMAKAMKYENLTRASKFTSNLKKEDNIDQNELLMLQKISKYVKPAAKAQKNEEITDFIVEKPEQQEQILNFDDRKTTGLPFFRSIEIKLGKNTL